MERSGDDLKDAIEIYTHSVDYALEHGEIERYRLIITEQTGLDQEQFIR